MSKTSRLVGDLVWIGKRLMLKALVVSVPISVHLWIGSLRGRVCRILSAPPAHIRRNIQLVFGEDSELRDRVALEYLEFSKQRYLWRLLPLHPGFKASTRFPILGLENLEAAKQQNRATMLVTAHLGHPHIIPWVLEKHGYPVRQVLAELDRPEKNRQLQDWLDRSGELKASIFQKTKTLADILRPTDLVASLDVRPLLSALSSGEIVMIAGDGLRATQFINFPLLGQPYPFPTGFIKIAKMTDAVMLPVFAVPSSKPRGIEVHIRAPLKLDPKADLEENLREFAEVLGDQLQQTPHLWLRWKISDWFDQARERAEQISF